MKPEEIKVGAVYEGVLSGAPRTVIAITDPKTPEYRIVAYRVPRMRKPFHTAFLGEFAGWATREVRDVAVERRGEA